MLNSAARLVFTASRYDCITPLKTIALAEGARVHKFKLAVLVYRYIHQTAPQYLAEELHQSSADEAHQRLCSASTSWLVVRRTHLSTISDQAFPVAAARI